MPLVNVYVSDRSLLDQFLRPLAESLRSSVAAALHVPEVADAHLSPEDVEVRFQFASHLDIPGPHKIQIHVTASYFPERAKDLGARTLRIMKMISGDLGSQTAWIWITLPAEAAFVTN